MNARMYEEAHRRAQQVTGIRPNTQSRKFYDKDGREAGVIYEGRAYYAQGRLPVRQGPPMQNDMPPIAAHFNHVNKMSSL